MAFYGKTIKQAIFFHIEKFLLFCGNKNELDKTDENYDGLWCGFVLHQGHQCGSC
jgi:hypothetical protein